MFYIKVTNFLWTIKKDLVYAFVGTYIYRSSSF